MTVRQFCLSKKVLFVRMHIYAHLIFFYSTIQVADMKAEYIPPREDVIMQNEAPDDLYIIVSGEVEIISCEMDKERVLWTLRSGDMFGEVGALCCKPQCFTYRTKILSQVLRLKTSALFESMKTRHEDNITMIKNFLQVCYLTISSYLPSETGSFLSLVLFFCCTTNSFKFL